MQDYKVLSKGGYSPKTDAPVNITQWLLVERDGRKYLLLKLSKDGTVNLNRVRVKINMLDKKGKYVGTVSAESRNIPEKNEFVFDGQIEVNEACVSFKAETQAEDKSGYIYSQTDKGVSIDYAADAAQGEVSVNDFKKKMGGQSVIISERSQKAPVLICIFACVLLVCAILFTCLQLSSFKDGQYDFLRSGVEYTFVNGDKSETGALYVTGYSGNSPEAVIPERIEKHPVVQISEGAFSGNKKIKYLTVEGDTQICLRAFYCCPNLTSVKADGVTQIDVEAFYGCEKLKELSLSSIAAIGRRAFYGCGLGELKIPVNTAALWLGDYAFAKCESLKEISIERKISYSKNALVFDGAASLVSLSLENIAEGFAVSSLLGSSASALETVRIKNLSAIGVDFCSGLSCLKSFTVENLEDTRIGERAFNQCSSLKEVNLPHSVTAVGGSAFYGTAITSFDGNALADIGENAFCNCSYLKTFSLEGNTALKAIGSGAFYGCESLEKFIIPAQISELPNGIFTNCSSLEKVIFLSDEIFSAVGGSAFKGCSSLKEIALPESVQRIGYSAFSGCSSLVEINLPERVSEIAGYAFEYCTSFEKFDIPNTVTAINAYAFRGCSSLKSFTVDENITFLGIGVLQDCSSLEELCLNRVFGGYVGYVFGAQGNYVSGSAPMSLKKLTIKNPAGLTSSALSACTKIEELSIPLTLSLHEFYGNISVPESLKKVEVTGVTSLPEYAFENCTNIKTVTLPDGLKYIGAFAFYGCSGLRSITIPRSVVSAGQGAFTNCYKLYEIYNLGNAYVSCEYALAVYGSPDDEMAKAEGGGFTAAYSPIKNKWCLIDCPEDITELVLPSRLIYNGAAIDGYYLTDFLFYGTQAVSAVIPSVVTGIGAYAFYNCVSLERVEILAAASIGASAFENCIKLVSADMPYGSGVMGERAFYGCTALESMVIPSGITAVGQSAFAECVNLAKVTLPSSLREIYAYAFTNCAKLRAVVNYSSLIISAGSQNNGGVAMNAVAVAENGADAAQLEYIKKGGVTYLRYKTRWYAVWGDSSVGDIKIDSFTYGGLRADEIYVCSYAFSNGYGLNSVVIGPAVKEIGAYAFNNCFNISKIQLPSSGLTKIGEYAFSDCSRITEVNIPYGVDIISDRAFANCLSLTEVRLPDGVRSIGKYAFAGCTQLKTINLPSSLTKINEGAFSGCYSLAELNLPANLSYLGTSAFANCSAITAVRLPEKITYISDSAFVYCSSLADVVLPSGLTAIGNSAFYGCISLRQVHNLSELNIRAGSESYGNVAYYAFKVFNNETQSLTFATDGLCRFVLIDNIWYLYAYEGSYYRTVILPEKFTVEGKTVTGYSLKSGALKNCRSVMVPSSVNAIESGAIDSDATIYYGGAQTKWLSVRPQSLAGTRVYFYTDKIDGSWQWTYDQNGNIITD